MKRKTYGLLLLFCLSIQLGFSQFRTSFNIQNNSIKVVLFDAQQVSLITLETGKQSEFNFSSASEGTYQDDLYFDYEVKKDSLIIKSIYPKHLEFGDNKMTSMQEFSVSVKLSIPKNLKLFIDSEIASIEGSGDFQNLYINTKSGDCKLINFTGNADINTYDGRIYVKTKQAKVEAKSQNGAVKVSSTLLEKYQLNLRSVNGDIVVIQPE